MFQDTYRSMNESVRPDPELVERAAQSGNRAQKPVRRMGTRLLRSLAAAAAVLLCFGIAAPSLAQHFKPVNLSSEVNGIRMEVVSACIYENKAEIYITMQDLTGDRIDETIDLFDSYDIHRPFDSSGTCTLREYDPATRTATFLIEISEWGDHRIAGDKITFSVGAFLSRKTVLENAAVAVNLADTAEAGETMQTNFSGFGGMGSKAECDELEKTLRVLVPGEPLAEPAPGITITGIAYTDGLLHIQTATHDKLTLDPHASLWLVRADGTVVYEYANAGFRLYETADGLTDGETLLQTLRWNNEKLDSYPRTDYEEYLFRIDPETLSDCTLYGDFYTSGLNTKGDWSVTFPLENAG